MPTIVGVKLRNAPKPVLLDTKGLELSEDGIVVVSGERGPELGKVVTTPREPAEGESADSKVHIDRSATSEDLKAAEDLHRREREAMPVYRRLVTKHGLDMKPIDVEFLFDGGRAIFYFVAEERVDFRDLVRDLASEFHVRVDMRQVGVRDEARMIGGLGHCGEQLCCVRFGGEFQPVSIRMAKEQDLPLNPLKISGLCGRLMCCLRYEFEAYKDFKGRAPRKGAIVEVGEQKGKVVDFNTPKETVTMRLEEGGSMTVALADMDCASGQGCPCRVRAEALERQAAALTTSVASMISTPTLTSGTSAPAVAPSSTPAEAQPGSGTGRRRRRRGSGGGQPATGEVAKQPQSSGGRQQGSGGSGRQASSGGRGGQRSAPQPAREGAATAPDGTAPAAPPAGHRRRRRRSGPAEGAPPAE